MIFDALKNMLGNSTVKLQPQAGMVPQQVPMPQQPMPFADIMGQMPQQGFARPEAQQWMQQAMTSPYMQGWAPNGTGGATPPAPGPGAAPTAAGSNPFQMLVKDIVPSETAYKLRKNFRRAKDAGSFDLKDAAKLAGSVALGYATGGLGSAALSAASGAYGSKKEGKLGKMGVKATKRMWNEYLPQAGFTKKGKGWYDAEGTRISTLQAMQVMLDMGAFG